MSNAFERAFGGNRGSRSGMDQQARDYINQQQNNFRQQGRDPAREWNELYNSGKYPKQGLDMAYGIARNIAGRLFGAK